MASRVNTIEEALHRLHIYCRECNWKGYDPYDGLHSRVFQALPFKRSRLCRLAWIQLFKRLPFNLRPLILVPKVDNPKGLGLFARGLLQLGQNDFAWPGWEDAARIFDRLERLRSPGYEPWCWGYDFDWQGRAFFVQANQPNTVATTFVAHAFLDRYELLGGSHDREIARSACDFLLQHLNRPHETPDEVCFSYTPFDRSTVHNINFLIAAFLSRVSAATHETVLAEWARRALKCSVGQQAADGSWPYGKASFQGWVDHFHTCYNLLALDDCRRYLATDEYDNAIERGLAYYLTRLFRDDGLPRPDTADVFPINIHAVAVALITLTRFAEERPACRPLREKIIEWTLGEMQDRRGFFYYEKRPHSFVRIPYMRWGQAWMFYALSLLVAAERS